MSGPLLFRPEELAARPTRVERLRSAARRATRPAAAARREEDRRMMARLEAMGLVLGARFGLRWLALEAERDGVNGHYGICYANGLIRLRLRHARTGRPLKESSLVDTLCHELAHLEQMNHGPRFRRLYLRILDEARRLGYYRPGPRTTGPRQLGLFDDGDCGTG